MGFAINPSMNHLDVPEKYILEIHQSSAEVVLPDARFRGHPFEAYICITRYEKEMKAYVALLNNALKSTLVYTSDFIATTPQDYPRVFQEAEEFVKAMGFTLQQVNLDFSPAMREVIIKGLRVMRPPAPQKRTLVKPLKIDVPEKLVVSTGLGEVQAAEAGTAAEPSTMTELLSLKAELASARSALERVTREKVASEQQSASERGKLKASCEQAMESRRLAEERLTQAVRELKRLQQAQPPQPDSSELLRQREQLEQAAAATAALEQERDTLKHALQGAQERVTRLEGEKAQLEQRLAAGAGQLSALRQEIAAAKEQLAAARTAETEAADKLAAMAGFEQSLAEALQREKESRRQADAIGEDLATARGQLEEMRQRVTAMDEALASGKKETEELRASSSRAEESRSRLAGAETELAAALDKLVAANAEIARLKREQGQTVELQQRLAAAEADLAEARARIAEREATPATAAAVADRPTEEVITRIADEKAAVEAEYVRLATESRETEATLSESLSQAEAEIERLTSELEIQGQVAAMEQAALRAELRRLIVEGGASLYAPVAPAESLQEIRAAVAVATPPAAPSPPQAPVRTVAPPEPEPVEELAEIEEDDDTPDAPIEGDAAILQEFANDMGGFYGGGGMSTTEFSIDPSLGMISYTDPGDVIAVFFSSNSVQAVPDGKGIQRCKGYIITTKTREGYRVYVAWYLTESGRVVVCLPEQQPSDSDECVQILKDAVSYFEIVGFMMEIADLGTTRRSYRNTLRKIPVLKKVPAA